MSSSEPPRATPIQYNARLGTRWEKEKAAAGEGAFDFPDDPRTVGPWVIGECVGKGASGRVRVARHSQTGQMAAVKILPIEVYLSSRMSLDTKEAKSEKHRMSIDKEIVMMKLMDHPNIVRIYDVFESDKELFLILEYVDGGELFDYLVNNGRMEPLLALCYFKQIIYGLSYAHAFSIIHRDLKPENVLIHSLNPPRIKIADWGMAAFAAPGHQLATSCGSPHYASPEIVNGKKYSGTATDIWSCGVILYALLTGRLPFDHKDIKTLLGKVKTGKFEIPSYVHHEAADLIRKMIVVDVDHRIKMTDILAHPFLQHDTPGLTYVPAPSLEELARPIRSTSLIKPELLRSLAVVCAPVMGFKYLVADQDLSELEEELLSPPGEGSLIKALYFLLLTHREKTLENYYTGSEHNNSLKSGSNDSMTLDDEWRIRHYPAPSLKSPTIPQSPESNHYSLSSKKNAFGKRSRRHTDAASPTPSYQAPLSPVSNIEDSPTQAHSSRQRPASPAGPRSPPPSSLVHNQDRDRGRPMSTPNPRRSTLPGTSPATGSAPAGPKPNGLTRKPTTRPRTRTVIDGLPIVNAPLLNVAVSGPATRTAGSAANAEDDGEYGYVTINMPLLAETSGSGSNNSRDMPTPPRSPRTILTSSPPPLSSRDRNYIAHGSQSPPPSSVPFRPVHAPQVNDPTLQKTINDIAGRFNVLVERDHVNTNVAARNNNGPGPGLPVQNYHHAQGQAPLQQVRLGNNNNEARRANGVVQNLVDESAENRSNKENRQEDGSAAANATPPSMKNRGIFASKEEKAAQRKSRPPPTELEHPTNTRRATLISPPPPAIQSPGPNGSNITSGSGSSLVGPTPFAPTSVVGEFKGWFSNLFNWKAQQYVLHSVDNYTVTRNEVIRLFERFGVGFVFEDERGYGVLRCRVDEVYDLASGTLAQKAVRFRVEFSPVLGYIHNSGPRSSLDALSFKSPHILTRADTDVEKTGELAPFASTILMIQEKGALSTFRSVYNRLKNEWKLGALKAPEQIGSGSGIQFLGAGLSTKISR